MEAVEYSRAGQDAAARMVKFVGTDSRGKTAQWWVNLSLVVASRLAEETVRGQGYLGEAATVDVLTLFLPASTPMGEALVVKVYGQEAAAVAKELDAIMPLKTQPRAWEGG